MVVLMVMVMVMVIQMMVVVMMMAPLDFCIPPLHLQLPRQELEAGKRHPATSLSLSDDDDDDDDDYELNINVSCLSTVFTTELVSTWSSTRIFTRSSLGPQQNVSLSSVQLN